MQDHNAITQNFSVAGALSAGDLAKFKDLGVATVISNLPDEEVINGFTSDVARAEAEAVGIDYVYMPANGATVMDQKVIDQFADVLVNAEHPVVAHCKTGTRSAILWGMVSSQVTEPAQILKQLEAVGFEFDFLEDEFEEQWEAAIENTATILPPQPISQTHITAGC
jgi:sulfide:quinone oxidoreductase